MPPAGLAPIVVDPAMEPSATRLALLERLCGIELVSAASASAPAISDHDQVRPAATDTWFQEKHSAVVELTQLVVEQANEFLYTVCPAQEASAHRPAASRVISRPHDKVNETTGIYAFRCHRPETTPERDCAVYASPESPLLLSSSLLLFHIEKK